MCDDVFNSNLIKNHSETFSLISQLFSIVYSRHRSLYFFLFIDISYIILQSFITVSSDYFRIIRLSFICVFFIQVFFLFSFYCVLPFLLPFPFHSFLIPLCLFILFFTFCFPSKTIHFHLLLQYYIHFLFFCVIFFLLHLVHFVSTIVILLYLCLISFSFYSTFFFFY